MSPAEPPRRTFLLAGLWLAMAGAPLHAQTCTATMDSVNLGNVDTVSGSTTDMSGTVAIACTGYSTPSVRVCVSLGTAGPSWEPRVLTGPGAYKLNYNLYKDATYTTMWGSVYDPQLRTMVVDLSVSSGAASANVPFYGRVMAAQSSAPAGAYSTTFSTGDTLVQAGGYSDSPPTCTTATPPQTQRFTFTVNATVISNCTIGAANIDFGQRGIVDQPANTMGVITATCTKGAPYSLALNAGTGAGATLAERRMTRSGGSQTLSYALYRDSGRTQVWGDGSGGTNTVSNTGTGSAQTSTVYANLPVQTAPPPGSYADTITVTVTF